MKISLVFSFVSALSLASSPLWADFSYDQTTQITGGGLLQMVKFAGAFSKSGKKLTEPMPETVSIKGNRMLRKSADSSTIMDLDQHTITTINFADKSYSVITFEQMKQQMDEAAQKMRSSSKSGDSPDVHFDIKVNDTGKTKQVLGNDTHEMVTTMIMSGTDAKSGASGAMNMLSDMWIAPNVAGYGEVRDFHRRLAEALGSIPGENPLLNRPDIAQAMARMYKDASKFDGIPLLTVTKVGISADAAANPTATPDSTTQAPTADSSPKNSSSAQGEAAAALAQAFGGRFGLGRHKKQDSNGGQSSQTAGSGDSSGSLLEMTSQVASFNSDTVDASVFNIPAGFKQVEARMPSSGKSR